MSAGGLLASMLGGATQSGLASANKIATENREHEKRQGLLDAANTRQDELLEKANAREDQKTLEDRAWQTKRDTINHNRSIQLASVRTKTSGSSKVDPMVAQRVKTLTEMLKDPLLDGKVKAEYTTELNQLTSLNGTDFPSVKTPIGEIAQNLVVNDKKTTAADEAAKQVAKEETINNNVVNRSIDLIQYADTQSDKIQLENIIRKQENNQQLTFSENSILLRYEEKAGNAKREAEEKAQQEQNRIKRESSSVNGSGGGHNPATSFFLNQALQNNSQ